MLTRLSELMKLELILSLRKCDKVCLSLNMSINSQTDFFKIVMTIDTTTNTF